MAVEARHDEVEFDQLLSRYLDGALEASEIAQLESRLLADAEFAERFSRWCLLHRQITELRTEDALHELMDQFIQGSPTLPKRIFVRAGGARAATDQDRADANRSRSVRRSFAAAAAIALAAFTGVAMWGYAHRGPNEADQLAASPGNAATSNETGEKPDIIATVTQLSDVVWQPDASVLRHGQQLGKGSRVALQSGMAKVTFNCGAEVVLQGPCDFVVQNQMVGFLKSGRLTADVPRRAFTFAILSPDVDFVDLGTSFGVNIGTNGRTALHVFQGEVLCSKTNNDVNNRSEIFHVTADNAIEFNTLGSQPADIAMDRDQFSRLIALRRPTAGRHAQVIPDHLALWLAADVAVTTDDQQRVVSWQDIVYGDNHSGEDAVQDKENARPLLVTNALGGRPALRFNGSSNYLLTTPLETTDNQTVLFVCQFSPGAFDPGRRWGGQILNYDGPDREPEDVKSDLDLAERTRYLSSTLMPGALQIGEPLLESEFKPALLTGQVFSGFVGSATVEAGRVDAVPLGANVPVVVAYRYDYDLGKASLWINGRAFGEARAFAPQAVTSRKIIGRHAWKELFFAGDLAEMQIYNKALAPEELASATAYLADKYSIAVDGTPPSESEAGK